MASDAGMKPPKRKELNSPEIETDLSRIQSLSREHDEENWEFRSWLKQNAPDDIDGIVQALSQKYFALIDCTQCANCCRSLQAEFKKSELHTIAETLGQKNSRNNSCQKVWSIRPARCWTESFVRFTTIDRRLAGRFLTWRNHFLHPD